MAFHGFNDAGWAQYKADRKFLHGGKRQVHLRKNFERRGKGGGGAKIIRVRGVGGQNVRLKWNGGAYSLSADAVVFYADSSNTPKILDEGVEALCVWRSAAERWEEVTVGEVTEPGETDLIFADFTATADSDRATDTITADIDQSWGATPGDTTEVTVHKLSDHDVTIFAGDKFRGIWDTDDEEWKLFWFDGLRLTVKGTVAGTDVTASTPSFTLSSPSLVNGWRLPGSITVTNNPPLLATVGSTVYARFNLTVGSGASSNWDTGDAGNFLHMLMGIGGYNSGASTQVVINEEGENDPKWGDSLGGLRFAQVSTTVTAASGPEDDDWGSGQVKLQNETTGDLAVTAINVDNLWIGISFVANSQVIVDTKYTPPRVVTGTCGTVSWS